MLKRGKIESLGWGSESEQKRTTVVKDSEMLEGKIHCERKAVAAVSFHYWFSFSELFGATALV